MGIFGPFDLILHRGGMANDYSIPLILGYYISSSKTTAVARFKPDTLDCIQGKSFEEKRFDQFDVKSFLEKTHLFSTKMAPIQKATFPMASAPDHCVQSKVHFPPNKYKKFNKFTKFTRN